MLVGISCPHCEATLKVASSKFDTDVRCPACHKKFLCAAPTPSAEIALGAEPAPTVLASDEFSAESEADSLGGARAVGSGGVSDLLTGLIAAGLTAGVFVLLVEPVKATRVGQMFAEGWVPKAIVFVSLWAATTLAFKFRAIRRQRNSLLYDVLPTEVAHEIRPDNAEEFRDHILRLPVEPASSFFITRVLRGLRQFQIRKDAQAVSNQLAAQADLDGLAVENSYTMVRVFIWAVPILGFIGTVLGIGDAVQTFATSVNAAQDVEVVKESLGGVTQGLGVAFNTTLIALVMSVLLMLPMNWLQKLEEGVLTTIGDYCNEEFVMRLEASAHTDSDPAQLLRAEAAAFRDEREDAMRAWSDKLSSIGTGLAADVVAGFRQVDEEMQSAFQRQVAHLQESASNALAQPFEQIGGWVEELRRIGTEQLREATENWQAQSAATVTELKALTNAVVEATEKTLEAAEGRNAELVRSHQESAVKLDTRLAAVQQSTVDAASSATDAVAKVAEGQLEQLQQIGGHIGALTASLGSVQSDLGAKFAAITDGVSEPVTKCVTALESVSESVGTSVAEHSRVLERVATTQQERLEGLMKMLEELHAGVVEDVPASLQAQAKALKSGARESQKMSEALERLVGQISAATEDGELSSAMLDLGSSVTQLNELLSRPDAGWLGRMFGRRNNHSRTG